MKLMIICSKQFYDHVEKIKNILESKNIEIVLPNCYDDPDTERRMIELGGKEHAEFKRKMFERSQREIENLDAVLVLNFDKEKDGILYKNYIGGATFLEMYDAYRMNKDIYLYNDIPEGILFDEIDGFEVKVIHGDLDKIEIKE